MPVYGEINFLIFFVLEGLTCINCCALLSVHSGRRELGGGGVDVCVCERVSDGLTV